MRKIDYSPYAGGVGVIEYHMRRHCWRQLTETQAAALWQDCKAQLTKMGLRSSVKECEEATRGSLDTLIRGDVLDALALLFTGKRWPLNMTDDAETTQFNEAMRAALATRGYAVIAEVSA